MTRFDQHKQKVDQQYNAGRDQIIQNVMIVGRFLDFAKVEGLLPDTTQFTDFQDIIHTFEKTTEGHIDLTKAIGFAGGILKELVLQWTPQGEFNSLQFRKIIPRIAYTTTKRLIELGYWENFCEHGYWSNVNGGIDLEIIFLESLTSLWKQRLDAEHLFGIALHRKRHFLDNELIGFVETRSKRQKAEGYYHSSYDDIKETVKWVYANDMESKELRIFMAGLVIDLIRIGSEVSADHKFWEGLIELFGSKKAEGKD